ncbi:MarR family winged helix-turn-helix transcriptional regulator [Mesorhizobium sp. NPDC059025]|uniref:MarR family winged helix-turn-helix transcriptional regulator n=1 Tax=unclassified Mesorhizobium TaxID=325217 RepID=UPI0036902732
MPKPSAKPIGLDLAQTAKVVRRALDDAMIANGGSLPVWSVLISVKSRQFGHQRQLAQSVGIQGATLTHHLNAMEADGLLTRRRDPANRRKHLVELTPSGEAMFLRLRETAIAFDRQLRTGMSQDELDHTRSVFARLRANVDGEGVEMRDEAEAEL